MSKLLAVVLGTLFFTLSLGARAALIEIDWALPGDELITRDTDTGLEWLDMSVSYGPSRNQILLGARGLVAAGFRYATADEVRGLLQSANLFETLGGSSTTNPQYRSNMLSLIGLIGYTQSNNGGAQYDINAQIADPRAMPGDAGYWFSQFMFSGSSASAVVKFGQIFAYSEYSGVGNFLVRDAAVVPLPAAAWLFGSGLLGIIGFGKRKASPDS